MNEIAQNVIKKSKKMKLLLFDNSLICHVAKKEYLYFFSTTHFLLQENLVMMMKNPQDIPLFPPFFFHMMKSLYSKKALRIVNEKNLHTK